MALWYNSDIGTDAWVIGQIKDIGSLVGTFVGMGTVPYEANIWYYQANKYWYKTSTNVVVELGKLNTKYH